MAKAEINSRGKLEIDLVDLLDYVTDEAVENIYSLIGFQDFMVEHMCNLLVEGYSEFPNGWNVSSFADKLRSKILPVMDEISIEYITNLTKEMEGLRTELKDMTEWAKELNKIAVPEGVIKPVHKKTLKKNIDRVQVQKALDDFRESRSKNG